jgi:hypothetical protein
MNLPYERADLVSEALYPMGCGMAVRRSAVERVGGFDDHMINYYDDVDYGIRLWRAGYRVVVAPDAWIDHGFGHSGGDSPRKQLLCERHRMRVILTHAPSRTLPQWAVHEGLATIRTPWPRRDLKWQAMRWNARHLVSTAVRRLRMHGSAPMPAALMDPSWGESFPQGVPPLAAPLPERASNRIDMTDPDIDECLSYGWFPAEKIHGRSYRWAGIQASALIHLDAPARRLRLEYAQVPVDTGGVELSIRRLGTATTLIPVWRTRLLWQYIERCVENHPLSLPRGDYEVVFSSREAWSDPPLETRPLGMALADMSFEESFDVDAPEIDMASPGVEKQLVRGWFEGEASDERSYRWGGRHAAAVIRLRNGASNLHVSYCLPPATTGALMVTVQDLDKRKPRWSTRMGWEDASWHEATFPVRLAKGDYLITFEAEATWSNPDGLDPAFSPENRSLGFALSRLSLDTSEANGRR